MELSQAFDLGFVTAALQAAQEDTRQSGMEGDDSIPIISTQLTIPNITTTSSTELCPP
jgi:hypothetical protein